MADALNSEVVEDQTVIDTDEATAESVESQSEGEATVEPEVDVIVSEPDSQPGKGYKRLIRRLNKAKTEGQATAEQLAKIQEENRILKLALEQERTATVAPNPADFDEGVSDPEYVKAQTEFIKSVATQATQSQSPAPADNSRLERAYADHADRAAGLGVADYETAQEAAIDALGGENVNYIIGASPKSHLVLYYLGKNPEKAQEFRTLADEDAAQALMELGRLEASLKVKPKTTTQPAPDPDEEMPGSSGSGRAGRGPPGATYE